MEQTEANPNPEIKPMKLPLFWMVCILSLPAYSQNIVGNPSGSQTISQPSGTNFSVNILNSVRFADQFSGSDAGAKITAAIADLPSTGGTVDARGLTGAQTISATVSVGSGGSKPVRLLLAAGVSYSGSVSPLFDVLTGSSVVGDGWSERTPTQGSKISFNGTGNAVQIGSSNTNNSDAVLLDSLTIDLSGAGTGSIGVRVFGATHDTFRRLNIQNTPSTGWGLFLDTNLNSTGTGAQHVYIEQCRSDGKLHLEGLGKLNGNNPFNRVTTTTINTVDFLAYEFFRVAELTLINVTGENSNGVTPSSKNISAISRASNVVTVTTAPAHGFSVGQPVQIAGTTLASGTISFNGVFSITAVTSTTFTYTQGGDAATGTASTGTATTINGNYIMADIGSVAMVGCDVEGSGTNAFWFDNQVAAFNAIGCDFGGFTGTNQFAPAAATPAGSNPTIGMAYFRGLVNSAKQSIAGPLVWNNLQFANNNASTLYFSDRTGHALQALFADDSNNIRVGNTGTSNLILNSSSYAATKRLKTNQGTAYSGTDSAIVLSSGWGGTGAVSTAVGYDQALQFTVTPGGSGITANPTITITFKDGTWTNAPVFQVQRNDLVAPYGSPPHTWTESPTTLVITFNGTPIAGNAYVFRCVAIGKRIVTSR